MPRFHCGLLFLILLLALNVSAAPIITIDDKTESISLVAGSDIASANEFGQLSATDIGRHHTNAFSPVDLSNNAALDDFGQHLWLRFALRNTTDRKRIFWLIPNRQEASAVNGYLWQNNQAIALRQGHIFNQQYIKITVPPNASEIFFLQLRRENHQALDLLLKTPGYYLTQEIIGANLFGLALGMLLMVMISSLFMALYFNSHIFTYLGVYAFCCVIGQFSATNLFTFWWPAIKGHIDIGILTIAYLANASLLLLVRDYLAQLGTVFQQSRILNVALIINIIGYLVTLFLWENYTPIIWIPIIITIALIVREFYRAWSLLGNRISLAICLVQLACLSIFISYAFTADSVHKLHQLFTPDVALAISLHACLLMALMLVHYKSFHDREEQQTSFNAVNHAKAKAQNELLGEISHDLRTPVSGILGMTDLLENEDLSPKQQQLVEAIAQAGQSLLNNVAEISDRLQLQQSDQTLQKSTFELPLLVDEAVQAYRLQAEERNIELIVNVQPDVPTLVEGDAQRLRQILQQLIKNAVIYTSQGEVIVSLIQLNRETGDLLFSVRDTGRGITQQGQRSLMQEQRANDKRSGLYLVQQHLRALHTSLDLHSKLGEGSEFSFTLRLPIVVAHDDNKNNTAGPDSWLTNKRLLVVDDNHTCCKVIKQQASSWGMLATAAFDANEAMAMFRAKKNLGEPFDAVVVDYDMPHASGLEVAEKMLKESEKPPVIIMLTGLSIMPPEHITKQAGIQAVLNKPASQKLVRLTLSNLFAMHSGEAPAATKKPPIHLKVLIAEDNDVSRRVISKMMQTLNVQHKMVSDGQLAVDAIKKEHFDLVLMDCEMPVMNGFDATLEIRQWQKSREQTPTAIVALSAHILDEYKRRCREVGMDDFLEKPIKLADLETLLRSYEDGKVLQ